MNDWAKSRVVRVWIVLAVLAGASVGVFYAAIQRPSIHRTIVLRQVSITNGNMTDSRCASVPRGTSWDQVVRAYGWPRHIADSQRGSLSRQERDGGELDYPLPGSLMPGGHVRFCGIVFGGDYGTVDHVWEDLP